MIRLGTVAAIGFEDFDPPEVLGLYRRLGVETAQVYRNVAAGVDYEQMRRAVDSAGLGVDSLHGVYGDDTDPSCPDDGARGRAVDAFRREGELVRRLGGDLVVVHVSTKADRLTDAERDRRWSQLRRSIDELGAFGAANDVRYAFENLPPYHAIGADPAELAETLRRQGAPNTGLCFDSAHANFTVDCAEAIRAVGDQLLYTHMNDNDGRRDSHDMPGFGSIDWDAVADALAAVGYDGAFMLECFYDADRLRELLDDGYADRLGRWLARANRGDS